MQQSKVPRSLKKQAKRSAAKVEVIEKPPKPRASQMAGSSRAQLANSSYYLQSILDAFNYSGSKIPDLVTLPSATTQCVQRIQTTVNAQGVAGIFVRFGDISTGSGYQITDSAATSSSTSWNAATAKSYATGLRNISTNKRLVSAYVSYEYQGAPLNRKGRAMMTFEGYGSGFNSAPIVATDILVRPYGEDLNVADHPFGLVRYIPQDITPLAYVLSTATTPTGYADIVIDGATANDVVEWTLVENFEFIPNSNTLNLILPTPSISDPIEMSVAANAISSNPHFPVVQPSKDPAEGRLGASSWQVHSPKDTHHTGSEPTFFERFVAGAGKVLPYVKKGAEVGMSILPLLL